MTRRPTILDVARVAQVSPKTVSRVINGTPRVSDETAKRVSDAIEALDFHINDVARSLRPGQRSHLLGLVIGDLANPFYARLASGVEEVARANGNHMLMSSSEGDPDRERELVMALRRRQVDGMLMVPTGISLDYLRPEVEAGTPFVFVDRPASGIRGDVIVIENRSGARTGVDHLIAAGHRRIAMIGDTPWLYTAVERRAGYTDALAAAGIPIDEDLICMGPHDPDEADRRATRLLCSYDPPTAVFAGNNRICMGTIRAAIRADRQIAVLGFDDIEVVGPPMFPLAVIKYDPADLGRQAAQLLFDRLNVPDAQPQYITVPTELIDYTASGFGDLYESALAGIA